MTDFFGLQLTKMTWTIYALNTMMQYAIQNKWVWLYYVKNLPSAWALGFGDVNSPSRSCDSSSLFLECSRTKSGYCTQIKKISLRSRVCDEKCVPAIWDEISWNEYTSANCNKIHPFLKRTVSVDEIMTTGRGRRAMSQHRRPLSQNWWPGKFGCVFGRMPKDPLTPLRQKS